MMRTKLGWVVCATLVAGTVTSAQAADNFRFYFTFGPYCGCLSHAVGVDQEATDGYDTFHDFIDNVEDVGYAGIFHQYDPPGWKGPSEFYRTDIREPLASDESMTWEPIHVWADPELFEGGETMAFTIWADPGGTVPNNRVYAVELLAVPDGIENAPEIGSTWNIVGQDPLTIEMPTFMSDNGFAGYQFAFHVSSIVPEPGAAMGLALLGAIALKRRRD